MWCVKSFSERRSPCSLSPATAKAATGSCQKGSQCSRTNPSNIAVRCLGKATATVFKHSFSNCFCFCMKLEFHAWYNEKKRSGERKMTKSCPGFFSMLATKRKKSNLKTRRNLPDFYKCPSS